MIWADGWMGGLAVFVGTVFIGALGYFFLASVYAAFIGLFPGRCPGCSTRQTLP